MLNGKMLLRKSLVVWGWESLSLLCILTSKWVLHMLFAGQNRLSEAKNNIFRHKQNKINNKLKESLSKSCKTCIILKIRFFSGVDQLLGANQR